MGRHIPDISGRGRLRSCRRRRSSHCTMSHHSDFNREADIPLAESIARELARTKRHTRRSGTLMHARCHQARRPHRPRRVVMSASTVRSTKPAPFSKRIHSAPCRRRSVLTGRSASSNPTASCVRSLDWVKARSSSTAAMPTKLRGSTVSWTLVWFSRGTRKSICWRWLVKHCPQRFIRGPATRFASIFWGVLFGEGLAGLSTDSACDGHRPDRVRGRLLAGPPSAGMLTYCAAATLYLGDLGFAGGLRGLLLWRLSSCT
jgi:hypothetical protein